MLNKFLSVKKLGAVKLKINSTNIQAINNPNSWILLTLTFGFEVVKFFSSSNFLKKGTYICNVPFYIN
jgi:hypothetical protein